MYANKNNKILYPSYFRSFTFFPEDPASFYQSVFLSKDRVSNIITKTRPCNIQKKILVVKMNNFTGKK